MDMQDKPDNQDILAHFSHLLSSWEDMLVLGMTGISEKTRQSAMETANRYAEHLWDDLVFLVNGVKGDILDDLDSVDQIVQKWSNGS